MTLGKILKEVVEEAMGTEYPLEEGVQCQSLYFFPPLLSLTLDFFLTLCSAFDLTVRASRKVQSHRDRILLPRRHRQPRAAGRTVVLPLRPLLLELLSDPNRASSLQFVRAGSLLESKT